MTDPVKKPLKVEELRERVTLLHDASAKLEREIGTLRKELRTSERWLRGVEKDLENADGPRRGFMEALTSTMGKLASVIPVVFGTFIVLGGLSGLAVALSECGDEPPPFGLQGWGTVMIATPDLAPIGARCTLAVEQVERGRCRFAMECDSWTYDEVHHCYEDSYEVSGGEGDTDTIYYVRAASTETPLAFSFDERAQEITLKNGDSLMTLILHQLEGENDLD